MGHPQTDIVVPVHGALPDVKECLITLQAHTVDYRILLVDDYSDKETSAYLYEFCRANPSSLLITTGSQRWFTRASNLGLRLVRTPRCVLLNSDTVLDHDWLEELYFIWEEFERQCPGRRIGLCGSIQSGEEPRRWAEYVKPAYVTGHCLLLSMEAIADIAARRGMPGWYFSEQRQDSIHIRSDMFMSFDLNDAGYATIVSFKSACGHKGYKSWGADLGRVSALRLGNIWTGEVA